MMTTKVSYYFYCSKIFVDKKNLPPEKKERRIFFEKQKKSERQLTQSTFQLRKRNNANCASCSPSPSNCAALVSQAAFYILQATRRGPSVRDQYREAQRTPFSRCWRS